MLFGLLSWSTLAWLVTLGLLICFGSWVIESKGRQSSQGSDADGSSPRHDGAHWRGTGRPDRGGGAAEEEEGDEGGNNSSSSCTNGARLPKCKVAGATGEIERILLAQDHYAVLELARDAASADIKKAYRLKQLATHPDRNHGAGAVEASQRVNEAYSVLTHEIGRRQYDAKLAREEQGGLYGLGKGGLSGAAAAATMDELNRVFEELVKASLGTPPSPDHHYPVLDPEAYQPGGNTFHVKCDCGFDHIALKVHDRSRRAARRCDCDHCQGGWLPASEGNVWFEHTNVLLYRFAPERFIKAYGCIGGHVYDVTTWAKCQGLLMDSHGTPVYTNRHPIFFKMSFNAPGGKQTAGEPTSPTGHGRSKGQRQQPHHQAFNRNNKKKKRR